MTGSKGGTCSNLPDRGEGFVAEHVRRFSSQTCPRVYVIAINSNSRKPNDVLFRQGLIDRWEEKYVLELVSGGDSCPYMFNMGVLLEHALGYVSLLFVVTLHSFNLHPA